MKLLDTLKSEKKIEMTKTKDKSHNSLFFMKITFSVIEIAYL